MTLRRPMVVAVSVLCACALVAAGCGNAETTTGLYPVSVDGKWGYIDNAGAIKIQPQYEVAVPFSEGLAAVSTNDGWGYVDASGTMVIQPQFGYAAPFSEGLASVGKLKLSGDNPLLGSIDKTGAVVIPMQYEYSSAFSEGLCNVQVVEGGWGYIDKTGTMVIEPKFSMADFSEGLAAASGGYIDKNGDWVIELPMNVTPEGPVGQGGFSEGLAVVDEHKIIGGSPSSHYGYIDTSGSMVIQPQFDFATDFSEGLAAVGVRKNDVVKYGYIDKTGAWVIQPQYDGVGLFSEGLAVARVTENGATKMGYIDTSGVMVIQPQFVNAYPFSGGIARVIGSTAETGADPASPTYIDTTGKVIWQGK